MDDGKTDVGLGEEKTAIQCYSSLLLSVFPLISVVFSYRHKDTHTHTHVHAHMQDPSLPSTMVLSNKNIIQDTNASCIPNFKISTSHIRNNKNKQERLILK